MNEHIVDSPYVLTADIGGSHITAAICHAGTLRIIPESISRAAVNSKATRSDIFNSWQKALISSRDSAQVAIAGLAVAMPGPFDYQNGISLITGLNKYEAIYQQDIKSALAGLLDMESKHVLFRNDAEATVAGEALLGAGAGYGRVAGITLGTGFGSAFHSHTLTTDLNYGSYPYGESIADEYFSTRWFTKRYAELSGNSIKDVKTLAENVPTDHVARQVFDEFANNLAEFLKRYLPELAPDILVLCGSISKAAAYFLPHLRSSLPELTIQTSQLGEEAALIGAAELFTYTKTVNT